MPAAGVVHSTAPPSSDAKLKLKPNNREWYIKTIDPCPCLPFPPILGLIFLVLFSFLIHSFVRPNSIQNRRLKGKPKHKKRKGGGRSNRATGGEQPTASESWVCVCGSPCLSIGFAHLFSLDALTRLRLGHRLGTRGALCCCVRSINFEKPVRLRCFCGRTELE